MPSKKYAGFEQVLTDVGSLGRYQWFVYAVMQYSNLLQTTNQNFIAFGKILPPWNCWTDEQQNRSWPAVNRSLELKCPNRTLCELDLDSVSFRSLVQEWELYCSSYVPTLVVIVQMLGLIPGSLFFNHLADNYGRKWSCHLLNAGVLVVGLASAFAQNWQGFVAARFFLGFLFGGLFLLSVVTQMEIIDDADRMKLYALDAWSVSNAALALLAYLTGEWRLLIIVSNCICIPLLVLSFWIRESPRWLLQKQRYDQAAEVLNHIARWNRSKVRVDSETLREMTELKLSRDPPKKRYTFADIFHSRQSTIYFFLLCYSWLATSCMSYGLVYQNTSYSGSPFANYAFAAGIRVFVQVLIYVTDQYLKMGRRLMYLISLGVVSMTLSATAIITIFSDPETNSAAGTALKVFGLISSGSMSALWLIIYLLPIEIFPTVIRSIAMGGCSVAARIGGVLGPQLLYLKDFWLATPFLGFAILAIINFISVYFILPETGRTKLPDSLNDHVQKRGARAKRNSKTNAASQMQPMLPLSSEKAHQANADMAL